MNSVKKIVHAKEVYESGLTGENVRIALLDTGVAMHPDIKNHIRLFKDYVSGKTYCYDDNGHGTHIAGILCGDGIMSSGKIQGMAPKADLFVFKILDEKGNGKTEDALKALDWLLLHHKKYHIRLLNFSMGYRPDAKRKLQLELLERIEHLWDEGVIVVTAAGNNGPEDNTITIPGISRKVITVGACKNHEIKNQSLEDYSGRGPTLCCIVKPEILAPGTDILSLSSKRPTYMKKSGTSMAVPVVCGGLALALEKRSKILPEEIKILLYESVDNEENLKKHFWGVLNVDKLIKML
jgi:serine protease AprX